MERMTKGNKERVAKSLSDLVKKKQDEIKRLRRLLDRAEKDARTKKATVG